MRLQREAMEERERLEKERREREEEIANKAHRKSLIHKVTTTHHHLTCTPALSLPPSHALILRAHCIALV